MKRFTIAGEPAVYGLAPVLLVLLFLLLFPVVLSNPAVTTVAVFTLLFAAAATGWNIFSGYTGYISFGHAAYYGLGTYFFALLCQVSNVQGGWLPFLLVPLAGLITVIVALPLGWLTLKTRRYRFLMLTIVIFAFSAQVPNLLTGTPLGGAELSLPIPPWSGETFNEPYYYVACAILVMALLLSWWMRRSKYGLVLLAIRDDEERALGLGVRTDLYKLSALLISAMLVSMVGAVSSYFLSFVAPPSAFDPRLNIIFPLLALFGGAGTPLGPALGALVLVPLQQNLTVHFGEQGWDLILYGVVFLLVVLLVPEGVLPALQKRVPLWVKMISARPSRHEPIALLPAATAVSASPLLASSAEEATDEEPTIVMAKLVVPEVPIADLRSLPDLGFASMDFFEPTQKLRAIHLVGAEDDTEPAPAIRRPAPATTSTAERGPVPAHGAAHTTGGICPRCQAPLRAVEGMVFCRRCGLIVSKKP